jgi:cytochrome c553
MQVSRRNEALHFERTSMKRSVQSLLLIVLTLVAGAADVNFFARAQAQPAGAKTGKSDDLRAVYATSVDVADGKRVAEASCVRCHNLDGVSTTKGVPHIAGQRPAYLHLELRAYQTSVRGEKAMDGVVKYMSDDALVKVAAYYASLDPPQPVAASSAKPAAAKPDPAQAGKAAATACAACHGDGGISKIPGTPSLVSFDPKYLVVAMKAYKGGQRKHDMMKSLLGAVSDADMENIGLYYALQKPARAQTAVTGNPAAGKAAAAACAGCHGNAGVSGNPVTPSLAGQDAQYLAAAVKAYKDGSRSDETMKGPVASLDDGKMKDLAAFYATQQPQAPNVRKPLTTAEWAQRCDRCHGINGNSTDPLTPALAGQRTDYLEKVLHDYRTRARKSPQMAAMSDALVEVDIENLAAHYARQKARAVVFVVPQANKEK